MDVLFSTILSQDTAKVYVAKLFYL